MGEEIGQETNRKEAQLTESPLTTSMYNYHPTANTGDAPRTLLPVNPELQPHHGEEG